MEADDITKSAEAVRAVVRISGPSRMHQDGLSHLALFFFSKAMDFSLNLPLLLKIHGIFTGVTSYHCFYHHLTAKPYQ